jgi:FtsP/CotA-like multicopper oxidase with cupredoxin domain
MALVGSAAAARGGPVFAQNPNNPLFDVGCGVGSEPIPISPLVLNPFTEDLPVPTALAPVTDFSGWSTVPQKGQQNSEGTGYTHQLWCNDIGYPEPNVYKIALQVAPHRVTDQPVQYLGFSDGAPGTVEDLIDVDNTGVGRQVVKVGAPEHLPYTAMTAFSGTPDIPNSATFPGPMINSLYGKSNLIRFVNQLDDDNGMDLQDYGDPERGFLTHLHNAHTACESDGNPNDQHHQFCPGQWCDNLYLNYPAGGDPREMQSFLWFHDHTHGHTGANVYKGMVGLYPIYDPKLDPGNEKKGLRLPGVRKNRPDGAFDVKYDIPLALYDTLIDDGATPHQDWHNGCGETHPEWKGKQFFRHYPNHGFVGDVFTVNGKAYPVLKVKRRKYRLRFLGASIARIYELVIMRKRPGQTIEAVPGLQGQYSFMTMASDGTRKRGLGEQCFRPVQIASEGGLLPYPVERNSWEIWPANRKEFVVDFTKYLDGAATKDGDEFYICNIRKMKTGRKPNDDAGAITIFDNNGTAVGSGEDPEFDPNYCVPLMKIVIDGNKLVADDSLMPVGLMRALPKLPANFRNVRVRHFALARSGGAGGEAEWIINGMPFDPFVQMARVKHGTAEIWVLKNGSGGWVHPMHLHEEEHQVIARFPAGTVKEDGSNLQKALNEKPRLALAPDQPSKEDVCDLRPNEELVVYRKFRSYVGKYVAHCHNLAHEDHSMMFGWEIEP